MLTNYFGPWLSQPFRSDMDYTGWILFIVFILTIAILWMNVLRYITEDL